MSEDQRMVHDVLHQVDGAFENMVDAYQKLVWHIVYPLVQDDALTEDLCQEVFMCVYLKLKTFRFECSLGTWIGRIAFRLTSRTLKKKIRERSNPKDEPDTLMTLADEKDLEQNLVQADLLRQVYSAMGNLPPIQQTIMGLYYGHEFSLPEISAICQQPLGTVKSYLFRARKQVRKHLDDLGLREYL